jgi:hypothetical protein
MELSLRTSVGVLPKTQIRTYWCNAASNGEPVRTENLIRIELVMKSRHAGGDDRLDFFGPQPAGSILQVQEPT